MQRKYTYFDSTKYDNTITTVIPHYEDFFTQIIGVVNCKKRPVSWLDIGCGTGKMAERAYRECDIQRFCFCDISADMIEIAKSRFTDAAAEFRICSSTDINYINEFNVVTAIQTNHYFTREDRIKVINNCYNALKNEGIFITFENFAPADDIMKMLYMERWKRYQMDNGRSEAQCGEHLARYNTEYFPITINEHIDTMKRCGFKSCELLWLSNMQVGIVGIKQ